MLNFTENNTTDNCHFILTPSFLIIGAQKAGTTALFSYLSQHPKIKQATTKEINFFNCDSSFGKGLDFYHSHFRVANNGDQELITFEASPSYLVNEKAYRRIHSYNKDIKLIAILRNPVDRAFSAWNMYYKRYLTEPNWFHNWMKHCDENYDRSSIINRSVASFVVFEKAVEEEIEALNESKFIEAPILKHGFYYRQLKRYFDSFRQAQIHVVHSIELKNSTSTTLESIENFLGIEHHDWDKMDISQKFKGEYLITMRDQTRNKLRDFYEADISKLYELLGVDYLW
jgi:hypothetical protein